jgi:uncharacterized protein YbbC (DUF1343 family)
MIYKKGSDETLSRPGVMFERYTEKARRVIFFARYEASQFGSTSIEPEHILLGLIREDKEITKRFFPVEQVSLATIRVEIERRSHLQEKISTSVELPLSVAAKRLLTAAHEESERLGHRHIGTEHLLLGLLLEDRSLAAEILSQYGLRLNGVRDEIVRRSAGVGPSKGGAQGQVNAWLNEIDSYAERLLTQGNRLGILAAHLRGYLAGSSEPQSEDLATGQVESAQAADAQYQKGRETVNKSAGRRTVLGLEKLLGEGKRLLRAARVGLVCNQASVDHSLRHAADLFQADEDVRLTALFGPQHGIRGDVQDNMVETAHAIDRATGLPVYSLYSETREPTEEMLKDVDVLVFDMQDVGCRIYTFVYTLANCMRAAAKYGKKVIACDRPNPINGVSVAGTVLDPLYASFVGQFPLATRHGMTVCELALMFRDHFGITCDLETVQMEGWSREQWMDETDAPWVIPSPNMPTPLTTTVFPGTVHLEGTQMSEGRGTTRPFELIGAPYIEAEEYAKQLNKMNFPGVYFRACGFQPTFQKHAGVTCGGVQIHVTQRDEFEPVSAGVATVKVAYGMYREHFRWKEPPYEYVYDKNPFDVIAGTSALREAIERGDSLDSIMASWEEPLREFNQTRERFLCY